MAALSDSQRDLLAKFGICESDVFDASKHPSKTAFYPQMKSAGKLIAINTNPCRASGHRMRTRSGHCIECNPEVLAHSLRAQLGGFVYVFESKIRGLIKIGFSQLPLERLDQINSRRYSNASDWSVSYTKESKDAGRVEIATHQILEPFRYSSDYEYLGGLRGTNEIYKCDAKTARDAVSLAARRISAIASLKKSMR